MIKSERVGNCKAIYTLRKDVNPASIGSGRLLCIPTVFTICLQ